jgi:exosortase
MDNESQEALADRPTLNAAASGIVWWQAGLLLAVVIFLYYPILTRLAWDWWNDPEASHGILVPLFSLYVVWHTRRQWAGLSARPAWWGLIAITGALAIMVTGVLATEFFLSRSSFVFLLAGLAIYFLGWTYFRALLFPWAFLFLMIPIPALLFNHIAFPLQLLASRLASGALELIGVPVLREGNVMQLANTTLEVAEACSGIRSLLSLVTLAVIYGYFLEKRIYRRAIFAIVAVPIAVVANALRVVGTGALAHYWDPQKAEGFFHTFSGWVIFVIAMFMLFSVDNLLRFIDRCRGRTRTEPAA